MAVGTCVVAACSPPRPAPLPVAAQAREAPALPLVPAPRSMRRCEGSFTIDPATKIAGPREVSDSLARWLGLPREAATGATGTIELRSTGADGSEARLEPSSIEAQSFTLEVTPARAIVRASGRAGLFYGAQTLAQLAGARRVGEAARFEPRTVPCVTIEDRPTHAFRAMHLDVSRHFFDRAVVERYVDLLAFYRFNVFHWHLTDDQGFRLDLKTHPELKSADGAYSRDDVTAVVDQAGRRFVTVVPEIEMPGHARAILAVHPELSCTGERLPTPRTWGIFDDVLCAGNEGSYELVEGVLDETSTMFPSRFIHVGGDEVPPTRWNACPKCQAAMKAANVDAVGLEHVFMERVFAHLATLGRKPMVWDEALPEAPSKNPPIVVAWQSKERGDLAVQRGFDSVYAPYQSVYFNFKQSPVHGIEPGHEGHLPWPKVRAFDPGSGKHVHGGEGALWTEYVTKPDEIETLVMPRMAALADALWSGAEKGSDEGFTHRFAAQRPMLDASHVGYFIEPPLGLRPRQVIVDEASLALTKPPLFLDGTIRYTRDGSVPTAASPRYRDPLLITETTTITTALFLPNGRSSGPARSQLVKEIPRPPVVPKANGVSCTYYEGLFHRLGDIDGKPERARVVLAGIDLAEVQKAIGVTQPDHFAIAFAGHIQIDEPGVQRFIVKGDDGVRLSIDGERIVDIDGERGPREEEGEIALAKGLHRIDVLYFQGTEGRELDLKVEGPSGKRGPLVFQGSR